MNVDIDTGISRYSHTLFDACCEAQRCANETGTVMVVGLQTNDDTGEYELGWCPMACVGPAFVHTVMAQFVRHEAVRRQRRAS
jgi:hypothetical protein